MLGWQMINRCNVASKVYMATCYKHIKWFEDIKCQILRNPKMDYDNDERFCKNYLSVWLYPSVSFDP
jgi:hypothetical protein